MPDSGAAVFSSAWEHAARAVLRVAIRTGLKPVLSPRIPFRWQRLWLKQAMLLTRVAPAVDVEGGIIAGVRGEWLRPQAPVTDLRAVLLYLHGGGYCVGTPKQYRALTSHLTHSARIPCFAPAYRLAPEYPFPAALDDAVAVYQALAAKNSVVLAGDSAGGGLAIATAIVAHQRKLNAPSALVLFAPWVDLTLSRIAHDGTDPSFSRKWLAHCAHAYAGRDAAIPLVSPLFADLSALPRVLIQVGEQDLLRIEASSLHDALTMVSVNVTMHVMPASWHLFQLHAGVLSSATAAVSRAGDFIADAIRAQNAPGDSEHPAALATLEHDPENACPWT